MTRTGMRIDSLRSTAGTSGIALVIAGTAIAARSHGSAVILVCGVIGAAIGALIAAYVLYRWNRARSYDRTIRGEDDRRRVAGDR